MAVRTLDQLRAALASLLADNAAAGSVTTTLHRGFLTDLIDTLLVNSDLRGQASQVATPASGDRLFFTDENQSGDPLRYVQVVALARIMAGLNIITNIASYDATQNRFEDSSGNAVTVHNGASVALAESVYDAAVADAGFTPPAGAVYLFTS